MTLVTITSQHASESESHSIMALMARHGRLGCAYLEEDNNEMQLLEVLTDPPSYPTAEQCTYI